MPNDPFYKSKAWKKIRAAVLARDGHRCCACGGPVKGWAFVDHIVSRRRAPERSLDPTNLQTMCRRCHNAKSARQDGGFGNAPSARPDTGGTSADGRPRNPSHPWAKNR